MNTHSLGKNVCTKSVFCGWSSFCRRLFSGGSEFVQCVQNSTSVPEGCSK